MHIDPSATSSYGYRPLPPLPGDPLRGRAVVVQLALAVTLVLNVVACWAIGRQRALVQRVVEGRSISLADATLADDRAHVVSVLGLVAILPAAISFVVWFWRLRANAGQYQPTGQRRAQPWAFWGWICPIVSLWFPFQIAQDAARSTPARSRLRLLGWWWAAFLVAWFANRISAQQHPTTPNGLVTQTSVELAAQGLQAVAAVLAILVVRRLTRDFDDYRAELAKVATPWAG